MPAPSLAEAIAQADNPVDLLRNHAARPYTYPVQAEFTNWRTEQHSWRDGCALLDQSHHMTNLFIQGPDALALLRDLGVNSFANFPVDRAKQYIAVNGDGNLIADAILFHLEEDLFDLVGTPTVLNWIQYHIETGQRRVTYERDENSADRRSGPPQLYRYEVQGPTALEVLEKAAGSIPPTRFFHMTHFTIAGRAVRALRHGMAGRPGFEIFGPWSDGDAVLEALLTAGEGLGIQRVGAKAYSTGNMESGWLPAPVPAIFHQDEGLERYQQWLPLSEVGGLAGSMDSTDIRDYYVTPYDIGYGRLVAFDHDFAGREALEEIAKNPRRDKVTLIWDPGDVSEAIGSLFRPGPGAKYIDLPKARYALHQSDKVLLDGEWVGISTDCGYNANMRSMASLATVDLAYCEPGTEVTVLWGEDPNSTKPAVEQHIQWEIRATVAPAPFDKFAREEYRPRS